MSGRAVANPDIRDGLARDVNNLEFCAAKSVTFWRGVMRKDAAQEELTDSRTGYNRYHRALHEFAKAVFTYANALYRARVGPKDEAVVG